MIWPVSEEKYKNTKNPIDIETCKIKTHVYKIKDFEGKAKQSLVSSRESLLPRKNSFVTDSKASMCFHHFHQHHFLRNTFVGILKKSHLDLIIFCENHVLNG